MRHRYPMLMLAFFLVGAGPTVPPGFTLEAIAQIDGARELAVASNGDLFVGTNGSTVAVVPNAQAAKPGTPSTFLTVPDKPVAGITISGNTMYLGAQFGVYEVPFAAGDRAAGATPKKIAVLRPSNVARDHVTTTVAVAKGVLYASVGSSCNNCQPDLDATRATIQQMGLDGRGMRPKASHIRNAIALTTNLQTGTLWAGVAGQDELAHGHPYEIIDAISAHVGPVDYGWPNCYENRQAVDPARSCKDTPAARIVVPAYATPIGATFYPVHPTGRYAFPAAYRGGLFVTLHGSWHRPLVPPRVIFIKMNGDEPQTAVNWNDPTAQWQPFLDELQTPDGARSIRPTGIAVGPDGSLFIADDESGTIFRIRPKR